MSEIGRVRASLLPEGAMRKIDYPPYHVLVARVDGALHAIEDACPHSGESLCRGHIEDGAVVCPAHGWAIDLVTGQVRTAAGHGLSSPRFEARLDGDDVVVTHAVCTRAESKPQG